MKCPFRNPEFLADIADEAIRQFDSERDQLMAVIGGNRDQMTALDDLHIREINSATDATAKKLACPVCSDHRTGPWCRNVA